MDILVHFKSGAERAQSRTWRSFEAIGALDVGGFWRACFTIEARDDTRPPRRAKVIHN
jgi:hypothetical protein